MITVKNYIEQARSLLNKGEYTDGCSLSQFMHKVLSRAKLLCAAHDYGNLNKIKGVKPGLMNQFYSLAAHLMNRNPAYWIWGIVLFTMTLPWIVWRRNLGITFIRADMFFGLQFMIMLFTTVYFFTK